MLTQVSWASPVTSRLLLEANAQFGPVFLVGQPSEECVRYDADSGAGEWRRLHSGHQLPLDKVDRAHRHLRTSCQGAASYITGSHSAKFGFRYHHNNANYPINFYNNSQLKYIFQDGVPASVDVYADANSHQEQHQNMSRSMRRIAGRPGGCRCRADSASSTSAITSPSSGSGRTSSCPTPWCSRPRTARSTRRT